MTGVNVAQLLKEETGSVRTLRANDIMDVTGDGDNNRVVGDITLTRTNRGILVQGNLSTTVTIPCSRCLTPFVCPVRFHIEEEFFPTIDIESGAQLPVVDEQMEFVIDKHHILDLTEAIRQNTIVNIPLKPLCREQCAGLCPRCGHNLNNGPCSCPAQEIDPRWAKLLERKGQYRKN